MEFINEPKQTPPTSKNRPLNIIKLWVMLMIVYLFLLTSIGYVAFWEQDFNDPEKFLIKYELLRESHYDVMKETYGDSKVLNNSDEPFNMLVNECIKEANNTAGDLQELASQSFNIVLGALLAFLSATATMVFQRNFKSENK